MFRYGWVKLYVPKDTGRLVASAMRGGADGLLFVRPEKLKRALRAEIKERRQYHELQLVEKLYASIRQSVEDSLDACRAAMDPDFLTKGGGGADGIEIDVLLGGEF